ncbi:MAG TPA: TonB-dependent receptor [Vicinamibacterales bacterium]|nr:TonB-dependent receptor [Vicinamibacterales bacterium]
MNRVALRCLALLAALSIAGTAAAQGVQTGTLSGTVRDAAGLVLPGTTITVTSPALQGERTTVTDANGVYVLRGLPPGTYQVRFEMPGMAPAAQTAVIEVGRQAEANATLAIAGVEETVTVTGESVASTVVSPTAGANFTNAVIDLLPTARSLSAIASLAPGLTTNTPNAGQVTISGAFAYDNVFLIDGVDVNDNLFGTANNLFVEDAIEETQVLTSGISAEFGRFSGGVINAVTKSGGDRFSGSYRLNLTNDAWTTRTPFEKARDITRPDRTNQVHEWTLGGPILVSRLWFFGSGRFLETENQQTLPVTGFLFTGSNTERRGELKLTGTAGNHTFTGSYFRTDLDLVRPTFTFTIDPNIREESSRPNDRWVAGWRGVLTPRTFGELRWSQKRYGFRGSGGTDTNVATGSPFFDVNQGGNHYNAPYFDATDPEDRNNYQVAGSLSYFLTTEKTGSHDIKVGGEVFNSRLTGGNSQSPTNFVFEADYLTNASGAPVLTADGRFVPLFVPGDTYLQTWLATRGAKVDIRTTSLYVQDSWKATPRWTFDVGARYERVRGEATGDLVTVDTDTFVPRLAATYDVLGTGRLVAQSTYAWYSGKYSEAQFASNTPVGNPALLYGIYTGPAGQGLNFAPGLDPKNYEIFYAEFPTANVFFDQGLSSPVSREFTLSLGSQLGQGFVKGTFVRRNMHNFVEDFSTLAEGSTTIVHEGVNYGTFTNVFYRNSDEPKREYSALQFIGQYPLTARLRLHGNYTMQLRNHGNFEGEATNQPGISSLIGDYPEIYTRERHYPEGRLNDFQRHKAIVWGTYSLGLGRFGTSDLSLMYRYDSPLTYSLAASSVPLTSIQRALLAPYASGPSSQTLFFDERGSEEFASTSIFDFALSYQVPVFRTLRPWVKLDVFNLLNNDKLVTWNTVVRADPASPRDALGLPTGYTHGPLFGQGTSNANYRRARGWQAAVGFRF